MSLETLTLNSRLRDYQVTFQTTGEFIEQLVQLPNKLFVIDENVWAAHNLGMLERLPKDDVAVLPIGEQLKTTRSVELIWDLLMHRAAKRNMTLVSIGGGICQDITGFAASTLYRGIGWVFLPTTLLAQADSCIGSKTSLNYRDFKNLVGTFYPPNEIHVYAPFLATQSRLDFYSGVGEVVKLHIMGGRESAERLADRMRAIASRDVASLHDAVHDSLLIKRAYIQEDEFDTGRRNLLNYGHCFGHAIESATRFAVPHGQAVVLGMKVAQHIARQRGLETDTTQMQLLDQLFGASLLPGCIPPNIDGAAVVAAMGHDKKRTGPGLVLVMMADGFQMLKVEDLSVADAIEALTSGFLA